MVKNSIESIISLLSPAEKRFISEHLALRNKKNNFYILFNLLTSKEKGRNKKFKKNNADTYYATRNQLKGKILKILRLFHSDSTRQQSINNMLSDVEILFHKGAYIQCEKLVNKALTLCEKYEYLEMTLLFLSWKEEILMSIFNLKLLQSEIDELYKKNKSVTSKVGKLNYYKHLTNNLLIIYTRRGASRGYYEANEIKTFFKHFKNINVDQLSSYRVKIYYYLAYTYYYYLLSDFENCYKCIKAQLLIIEEFKLQSGLKLTQYLFPALRKKLATEVLLNKYSTAQLSIDKLRAIDFESVLDKATCFIHTYSLETDLYIRTAEFEKVNDLHRPIEEGIKKFQDVIPKEKKLILYYNMTYLYIGNEEYKTALKWVNKMLSSNYKSIREDIYCFAHILNLIIHYHLGNYILLEHITKSTYRYLYKKKRVFKIEDAILKFLRSQFIGYSSPDKLLKSFEILLHRIKELSKDENEKAALEYFDFISWIESQIQNRSFAEIVKD